MSNYIKYISMLLLVAIAAFGCHYLVSSGLGVDGDWTKTNYSLLGMYVFGFVCSLVVTVLILLVHWSMPKNLGLVFLGITTFKAVAFYVFIQPGLKQFENKFLEINFLAVFFLFLFFDVFVAFKMLNEDENLE